MKTQEENHPQVLDRITRRTGRQLRATAGHLGETSARAGNGLHERFDRIGKKFSNVRGSVVDTTKKYSRNTNNYVKKNPWTSIGISAGFAFLVGMMVGRKRNDS